MAGAGYKLFNTGDVLTAAQVNTYLQEQTVMVFANAAARTTALSGVLAEGMMSYLQDTNAVEVYNGSSWVNVGNSGDITGVTAGTGLSGGGTSGDVTLSLSTPVSATNGGTAQTTYTTGDLLYASASNTLSKRAIGTTGQVLTVSGGVPTWATAAGGGKVLQVVSAVTTTSTAITTQSMSDTSITATITPTSATSKILVIISAQSVLSRASNEAIAGAQLLRGATTIGDYGATNRTDYQAIAAGGATSVETRGVLNVTYMDSPATTSSTTYKLQAGVNSNSNSGTITFQRNSSPSSIILLEIGA